MIVSIGLNEENGDRKTNGPKCQGHKDRVKEQDGAEILSDSHNDEWDRGGALGRYFQRPYEEKQ